nr:MAG TPA: hypothetical protein [Caudoviricetes sp.]
MLYKYVVKCINMQYFSYICIGIGWSSYQLIRLTQWPSLSFKSLR